MNEKATKRDKPWMFRTYAGHSTAKASNELYRRNLSKGQTGLSVAFDLPTQTGYDPDHVLARGDPVGLGGHVEGQVDRNPARVAVRGEDAGTRVAEAATERLPQPGRRARDQDALPLERHPPTLAASVASPGRPMLQGLLTSTRRRTP